MRTKLILDHQEYYLLLDLDAEINKCLPCYVYAWNWWDKIHRYTTFINEGKQGSLKVIIGYSPKKDAPKLEGVPRMVELNDENVDVEELANNYANAIDYDYAIDKDYAYNQIVQCYKAAQSEKKYSEQQLNKSIDVAYCLGEDSYKANLNLRFYEVKQKVIESLTKEKEVIDYEVEMIDKVWDIKYNYWADLVEPQPKIENGIIYGKWITK